jgi:hypothetical protein
MGKLNCFKLFFDFSGGKGCGLILKKNILLLKGQGGGG